MNVLISGYVQSCELVKKRIAELTAQRRAFVKNGEQALADELLLDRRIRLLYEEYGEMQDIIKHLVSYSRRVGSRGEA